MYATVLFGAFFATYVLNVNREEGNTHREGAEPTGGLSIGGAPFVYADAPSDSSYGDSGGDSGDPYTYGYNIDGSGGYALGDASGAGAGDGSGSGG